MSGDFKSYSSKQETRISTLAKKHIHTDGKRGESHFLSGNQKKSHGADTHLAVQGHVTEEKLTVFF